ncbi:16S rRNA (guanine(966)-N(2))-methyltransferase RsmD [Sodalis-like secondary symbiont of Drepanosiphum platanoidis]|uniref:16S rRNA (guanine(966)-N(2))-methyltransferase RsmD n=1 Tax=Sodalis-like secondary symbiont of Drepanosiphum platanoidis TaxID=2994493 RepID=UPI003463FD1D
MINKKFKKNIKKIRIISGKLKNSKLIIKNNLIIRSTTNLRREMIFNWLSYKIYDSYCLDCFAGTGALGIESISRYASYATLIEKNYKIYNFLLKNVNLLKLINIKVIKSNFFVWIKNTKKKFNIIFIDPPFYKNLVNKTISSLEDNNILMKNSFIYIEIENNNIIINIPKSWILYKKKIFKNVICFLYKK